MHPSGQGSCEPDFFIAEWRVRPALSQLERGDVTVSVEARSLQVLSCLKRHAPNIVSKQRLIHEIWGETFVTDEVLSHAIWELRKAFGDDARKPRFIQTIARKGYRLLAEVSSGTDPEPLPPGCRIGHYEILERIGGGAMGEVYKARDLELGRIVALKFLPAELTRDPSARRRFEREAQAVAQIDHPNVATIYEVCKSEGGRVFLALAFYEGETLQQKLEKGPLPLTEALGIACQIARGLAAAHRRDIVHRDIKPANIIVLPDGTVKILDFGLAKMTGATTLTRLGASPGTPAYKSPEQTKGDKVDPRSDLWALGVVLYEMLTGRVPFGGEYEQAVIYSILNEPPKPLGGSGEFPSQLSTVIERALAKNPEARYQTVEELEKDLARIPLEKSGEIRPRPIQVPRPARRRMWWIATAVVVLLMIGGVAGVWWMQKHRWDYSPEVEKLMVQGDLLEWQGDTKRNLGDAEQAYRKALELAPDNPMIQAQLAALQARIEVQFPAPGRREEIWRLTEKALELASNHPLPWVARAKLLLLDDKPKEAEKAALKAIKLDDQFDRGYTLLGEALFAQGRLDESFKAFEQSINVGEGYVRAGLVFAAKLHQVGRYDDAVTVYHKVLRYNPGHPTAKYGLGSTYTSQARYLDAIPLFRDVFDATQDPRAANSLGIAYFQQNQMNKAIQAFGEAYRRSPDPPYARNLAESYEAIGQRNKADQWYMLALGGFDRLLANGEGQRAELLYGRSFCASKLGRFEEALGNVEAAIALDTKRTIFLFRAAQICAMAGLRDKVYSWTRKAIQAGHSRGDFAQDLAFRDFQKDAQFREIIESATL